MNPITLLALVAVFGGSDAARGVVSDALKIIAVASLIPVVFILISAFH